MQNTKNNKKYKFGWREVITTKKTATIEASSREEAKLKWQQGEFTNSDSIILDSAIREPRILEDTK